MRFLERTYLRTVAKLDPKRCAIATQPNNSFQLKTVSCSGGAPLLHRGRRTQPRHSDGSRRHDEEPKEYPHLRALLITGIRRLMPVITPRLTGHNARRWLDLAGQTVGQGLVKTVVCAQLEPPAGVVARYPVASASGRFVQHRSVDRPSTWRQRKFKRRRRGGNASSNERTPTVGSYRQPICIQFLYSFRTGGAPPPCRMTIAAGLPVRVCRVWQGRSGSSRIPLKVY